MAVAVAAITACQFSLPHQAPSDGAGSDAALDAFLPLPDAGACLTASAECANVDVLRVCAVVGGSAVDTPCSWGCRSDNGGAHCALLSPSGGFALPADTVGSDVGATTLDNATINQTTGAIANGAASRAGGTGVISGIDFELRNGVGVFRFADLMIQGSLSFTGSGPVVLVSTGSITVDSAIQAYGGCTGGSPRARRIRGRCRPHERGRKRRRRRGHR